MDKNNYKKVLEKLKKEEKMITNTYKYINNYKKVLEENPNGQEERKQYIGAKGFKIVYFKEIKEGKINYKQFFVHRLIAIQHLPNPNDYHYVSHNDNNKLNNDISNLSGTKGRYDKDEYKQIRIKRHNKGWFKCCVPNCSSFTNFEVNNKRACWRHLEFTVLTIDK